MTRSGRLAPAAWFVLATVLLDAIGFGIIMPVVPEVVMSLGHTDLAEATRIGGWMGVVYASVQFLTGPLVGNLSDRFGRRPVLLCAVGGYAVDFAMLGFAPSLAWLFFGRAVSGLFGASFGPAGSALADLSRPDERAHYFGMLAAAFGIGFIVGPAIGGLLGELGPRVPFHAAALLAAGNFLFGLRAFPETLPPDRRRPFDWRRANPLGALLSLRRLPGVIGLAVADFWWNLAGMVYPAIWAFYAIVAFGWSPGLVGASLAWVGLLMAASQMLLVGRIVARIGERPAAIVGVIAGTLEFVGFAVVREGWQAFAIMLLNPLQSLAMPALSAMMSRAVPADRQGELQGFNGSVVAVASILAPALFNPLLAWTSAPDAPVRWPGAPFALAAVFSLLAAGLLAWNGRGAAQTPPAMPS